MPRAAIEAMTVKSSFVPISSKTTTSPKRFLSLGTSARLPRMAEVALGPPPVGVPGAGPADYQWASSAQAPTSRPWASLAPSY